MNWNDYKARYRELHCKRGELVNDVDLELEALNDEHRRVYKLDDSHIVIVTFTSMIKAHLNLTRWDADAGRPSIYHDEVSNLSPAAIHRLSGVKLLVDRYLTGDVEELPASDVGGV